MLRVIGIKVINVQ